MFLPCIWILMIFSWTSGSEGSFLLPFGPNYKDQPVTDGQYRYIKMVDPINLDDSQYQLVTVNKKGGYLSLRKATLHFAEQVPKISVMKEKDDFNKSKRVDVFFRVTNDTGITSAVDSLIEEKYKIKLESTQILVTTWIQYGCPNEMNTENMKHIKRTTQCILAGDASRSYVVYLKDREDGCYGIVSKFKNDKPCESAGRNCSEEDISITDTPAVIQLHKDPLPGEYTTGLSQFDFVQLTTGGRCLTLTNSIGYLTSCTDVNGVVEQQTVFRVHGSPGHEQIELFGSGKCLDREHCHSSTSNLRSSDCSHCGAINWDLRQDGTLREDSGANCIYVVQSSTKVAVHHSSDGCTPFHVTMLGNVVQLKSFSYGDCVANGVFASCSSAPRFRIYNLPRNYQMKDTNTGYCFDREHCHSSTSNTRLSECSHCGAIHWSIEYTKVGEDDMANCLVRGSAQSAVMRHCSEGKAERITCEISQGGEVSSRLPLPGFSSSTTIFPKPEPSVYLETIPNRRLMGARLYKNDLKGYSRLEFVHSLPNGKTFPIVTTSGVFQVQYWVSTIVTEVPHSDKFSLGGLLDDLVSKPTSVTEIQLRYGAVDVSRRYFGETDGLMSLFVTDKDSFIPIPGHRMFKHIALAVTQQNWWRTGPSVHYSTFNQSYCTFAGDAHIYRALYWPKL